MYFGAALATEIGRCTCNRVPLESNKLASRLAQRTGHMFSDCHQRNWQQESR